MGAAKQVDQAKFIRRRGVEGVARRQSDGGLIVKENLISNSGTVQVGLLDEGAIGKNTGCCCCC